MFREMAPVKKPEDITNQVLRVHDLLAAMPPAHQLELLAQVVNDLQRKFNTWQVKWGELNRYQRPADGRSFNDSLPSIPVGLASSNFGQLPSFQSRTFDTQKRYGFSGNSFIAAVEFGPKVKAKTIVTGGHSFDSASKNFTDQADGYLNGKFKDVLFYKADILKHAVKTYHPGGE